MSVLESRTDPLGVLASTKPVVDRARHVRIVPERVAAVAAEIAAKGDAAPNWDDDLHFRDGTWRTAIWVFALDALNFCFWSEDPDPRRRWRVAYRGQEYDGYWALAAALRRGVDDGFPFWDLAAMVAVTSEQVAHLLRPVDGAPAIPLLDARVANLQELGRGLRALAGEPPAAIERLLADAGQSAARLVDLVRTGFPSFDDVARLDGGEIRFFKRAQILVADLHGAFGGESLGRFDDLETLTAFADYKVPQVLRGLGVLEYDDHLATLVDGKSLIPAGSREEIEIRAATIWGCESIRRELARQGRTLRAFEIDWALWLAGQSLPRNTQPYHRTYTIFY